MEMIRVILARNRELWWDGLLLLLEKSQDIKVISICYDMKDIINKSKQLDPAIILIDEEIEGGNSGEIELQINKSFPEINIILVIKPYKDINLSSSFRARAKAYINKDVTYFDVESCIRHVAKGGVIIMSPFVVRKMLEQVAAYELATNTVSEYDSGLTKREKEVLVMLAKQGTTNKEIAKALFVTENTIKAHLSSILEKMKVNNRHQAAILARENNILSEGEPPVFPELCRTN
jgi:DNA-binding NarL/FixJ family response regulator